MAEKKTRTEQLTWAIENRARNQRSCVKLFAMFEAYDSRWHGASYSALSQDLLAIAFSLWRAAFLADKAGGRGKVFAAGKEFLEKIIAENTIAFTQDKGSKDWTFNFYTRNARYALEHIHNTKPHIVTKYDSSVRRPPTVRWEYCQELLEEALANVEKALEDEIIQKKLKKERKEAKAAREERRAAVRIMTEPDRKTVSVRRKPRSAGRTT